MLQRWTTWANLFLVYHEHKWLESCPIQFRLKSYCKYVDYVFLMFEHKDPLKKFLRYMMKSRNFNIQFTCQEESNDKIWFLNISVARSKKN